MQAKPTTTRVTTPNSTIHGATAKQKIALAFYEATNEMNGYYCGPFVDVQ